ncbi:hypothetical protein JDV02_010442 [Purpureocillium takamizusanense]|uniref:Subtilisin-like protease n=1 Tax=Purpureocillium takamizusanense TaxID=2060973 RepID=A0A9Q8QRT9_9HYPO|nr:uncharacterized protein JDV02_010442 [Purpureocillium takamizusanense]UNI24715.1 hypothetical protein JDV02_010442 [Purpureocillium takamizusanense]
MVRVSTLTSLLAVASAALAERRFIPGAYIFEVEDGHDTASVAQEVSSHGTTRMHLNYKLFKGVSVQLHDMKNHKETAAKLASTPGIKKVWPIEIHDLPDDTMGRSVNLKDWDIGGKPDWKLSRRDVMNDTDIWPPHVMTQVEKLRAKGITGKGIKLAIVDTGVDYTHPALGGCFGEGCRVSFGYDLVGDHYTGDNIPVPDPDPKDCAGHGTHVSGIIAAKDEFLHFTGAAPDVTLGMYRVFGCPAVGAGDDVLIAAFNMAFEAGADIITASIGGNSGWSENVWSVAVSRIVEQGVVCTLAAGNDGSRGVFDASEAADGKGVTAVASFENTDFADFGYPSTYSIDGGESKVFVNAPANIYNWTAITTTPMPLYPLSLEINQPDACDPLPDSTPDLSNYIVLVSGECKAACLEQDKAFNLAAKGVKYIILYDTWEDYTLYRYFLGDANITAAATVPARTGRKWVKAIKEGHNVTVLMKFPKNEDRQLAFEKRTDVGGYLSGFTSWGPSWEMDTKPLLGAPGGAIWSTWVGGYTTASGTSMATPITAAIMALILQIRGSTAPRFLENLVASNAKPQIWYDGKKAYPGDLAPVPQQGAGLVQAYDAAFATTLLDPSSISFNDTDNFVKDHEIVITNKGSSEVTHNIGHVPALTAYTLNKTSIWATKFPPEVSRDYATLDISDSKVTLKPGHRKTISVSARPPTGMDEKRLPVWSGYIIVNGTDGSALSLPYQGVSGSLKGSTTLGPEYGWVSWSNQTAAKYTNPSRVPVNYTFTLPQPGSGAKVLQPMLTFNLALGTRLMRADLVPMITCPPKNLTVDDPLGGKFKTIGQAHSFPMTMMPRGLNKVVWDGSLDSGEYAPAGKYKIIYRALGVYGNPSKLEDYNVAESQPFRIAYAS